MILLIDNYDSFTYNIFQYIEAMGFRCLVKRNDQITVDEIAELNPEKIVLSPGPGNPDSAGITLAVITRFQGKIPILGVCLGHQSIAQAFGGKVIRAPQPFHGKVSTITHTGAGVFYGIASPLRVARYHSLIAEEKTLPACLEITARTDDGLIMGLRHRELDVEGVQFHPESIATDSGQKLLRNFLCREKIIG